MRRGPAPHLWKSGPDPERHERYRAWQQQRNQARWRGEIWHLTFEEFLEIWQDRWSQRGRLAGDLCLTRRQRHLPWQRDNVELMIRRECFARQHNEMYLARMKRNEL